MAVACLPHSLSLVAIKAAIESKCHLVDLVGSMFNEKIELHEAAMDAGVIIVPGCGVAPGITNFLAAQGIEMLEEAEEATHDLWRDSETSSPSLMVPSCFSLRKCPRSLYKTGYCS